MEQQHFIHGIDVQVVMTACEKIFSLGTYVPSRDMRHLMLFGQNLSYKEDVGIVQRTRDTIRPWPFDEHLKLSRDPNDRSRSKPKKIVLKCLISDHWLVRLKLSNAYSSHLPKLNNRTLLRWNQMQFEYNGFEFEGDPIIFASQMVAVKMVGDETEEWKETLAAG
jgi:hypothetical protein